MARLNEQVALIVQWMRARHPEVSFGDQCAQEMENMIRRAMPGERIYVAAVDASKKQQIAAAARFLPTGVVAERFGVSSTWVRRVVRAGRRRID